MLLSLLLLSGVVAAEMRRMSIEALVQALQGQGHEIVYSTALVTPDHLVDIREVDIEELSRVLAEIGLALESREGIWVVVREESTDRVAQTEAPAPAPPVLETVIVTGSMHRLPYLGAVASGFSFSAEELALVPTLGSDAIRTTLRLPGMSSVGVSAKPRIRGGLQDELLILRDGVELLEPFHLADYHSPYSSIDYHTIETLDFYTGGFPSRYGSRMSGVMDISSQWREGDYNTDLGVSSFARFIHTRGEVGATTPTDWALTYREGDLSDLTDYIDSRSGDPEYRDAAARMSAALSERVALDGGVAYAEDDIEFRDDEERASSRIENTYAWIGGDWLVSPSLGGRATLSWLDFERRLEQQNLEDDPDDPGKGGFLDHRQDIRRVALRNDWAALQPDRRWEFGWQLEYNDGDYDHRSRFDRGELAEILGTEAEVDRMINETPDGWSAGAYVQLEWDVSDRLTLQPSLRWDLQDYYLDGESEEQVSPRFGMAYDLSESTLLRLSLGRFHQQEGIQELQVIDGLTRFFSPQYADQAVAGLVWSAGDVELVAEAYVKRYDDLKGRFENIFNPFVLLPALEGDRVGLDPEEAEVSGVDLDGRFSLGEPLQGFVRYSYMDARDRIGGSWIDRRWSQEHTANTGLVYRGAGFSLSVALTWHSGWRSARMPAFVAEGEVVPVETVLNNTRLRDYFSLDIGARKSWEFPRARLEIYADIINLTDRSNEAGIDYDIEEVANGYTLTPDAEVLLNRVSSVGVTLSF